MEWVMESYSIRFCYSGSKGFITFLIEILNLLKECGTRCQAIR
jgi:hypothetical protein